MLTSRGIRQTEVTTMNRRRKGGRSPDHEAPTVPLWLRRLKWVDRRARAEPGVWSAEASFRTGLALMAHALNSLRAGIRSERSHATEEEIEREMRRLLAQFAQLDDRWITRWRQERAGLYPEITPGQHPENTTGAMGQTSARRSAKTPTARNSGHTRKPR